MFGRFVFRRVVVRSVMRFGFRFVSGLLGAGLSGEVELELDGLEALQDGRRSDEFELFDFMGVGIRGLFIVRGGFLRSVGVEVDGFEALQNRGRSYQALMVLVFVLVVWVLVVVLLGA